MTPDREQYWEKQFRTHFSIYGMHGSDETAKCRETAAPLSAFQLKIAEKRHNVKVRKMVRKNFNVPVVVYGGMNTL